MKNDDSFEEFLKKYPSLKHLSNLLPIKYECGYTELQKNNFLNITSEPDELDD